MSNTEQKQKILLKRTTEVNKPSIPSDASHGELFLNIASGANAHNKISTMQIGTNNPIIWSDDVANEKKFVSKTEVEALVKEVEENELVTATAISTINTSAGFNEDGSSVLDGGVSLSEAIIELQNKTQDQGNYYFYLNELGELASSTISDEEIEKLRNSKNIYVVDNNNGLVFNCDLTVSAFDEIGVFGSVTTGNTNNTVTTMTAQIVISPTENRVTLVTNDFYVASSYLLRVTCDDTTGVIGRDTFISSSEIEEIRKSNIVFVKIELPEGEYTFSCSKKDDNDSIITLVGSQVYGLDGYWTNTSKIVSLIITIDTSTNRYSGQIYNIVTGEHSKLADSATTSISATTAVSASTSEKAYKDGSGNVISSTYASKTELENLIQEVEDSEFVTANALTQINKSAGFTEGGISKLPDQQSLTDAIIELQGRTSDLEESDPIFNKSVAARITSEDIDNWDNKLDKDGKAVSAQTADFATELTGRLEATSEAFTYRPSAGDKSIKDDNAFIRRVKGNSVVFNQLVKDNGYSNNGVVTTFNNGVFTLAGTPTSTYFNTSEAIPLVLGHTMLLQVFVVANPKNVKASFGDLNQNAYIPIDTGGGVIYTASGQVNHYLGFYESNLKNIDFTGLQIFQMLVDLTAMFGAGNEPTTVEEFRALYPNSYYPYNPGELRNFACSGIKTVGFNQWDEQWEIGYISTDDGINGPSTTCIRSANFIKCLPDTEYSATKPTRRILIAFYDFSKQYIGNVSTQNLFTTPINCAFIRFFVEYGTTVSTYNHDICINLHHTGYRDGEYEPYKEVSHALPLSQITNGEPLRKAGSVYDEINETEYIKRVGVVDLGSLTWWQSSSNKIWKSNISTIGGACYNDNYNKNLFCARYKTAYSYETNNELVVSISWNSESGGLLFLCDPQYDNYTVNEFKASLSGVLLHYELAEPIVKPIETPIDFNYYVEDFGTEEVILTENSAPFNADIIYQFNAVDRIRQNDLNIDRLDKELLLKQDNIEDLETIRNNATFGAAAYSWGNHADAGYLTGYTEQYKGTVTSVKVQGTNGLTGGNTVTASGTITISGITATSAATGVSKLVTGNLNGKTYTAGEAAAAAHTHSQYLTSLPSHNHDDKYYTESEINTKLAGKSDTGHTHSEYATTTAFNDLISDIEDNELVISTIVTKINDSCGFNENSESVLPNGQNLTEAIIELQSQLPVTLPTASTSTLGIMKVGSFLTANSGTVSVSTGTTSSTVARGDHSHAASSITSGTFNTARIPTGITVSAAKSASTISAVTGTGKYWLLGHSSSSNGYYGVYKNANVYMENGSLYASSDKTLKTHVENVNGDPELIKRIPKAYFHWNNDEDKKRQMGTYAQDLEEVYPELVTKGEDGIRGVAYDRLGVVALAGIDKLYEMIQQLQAKNDELENRIKELENK